MFNSRFFIGSKSNEKSQLIFLFKLKLFSNSCKYNIYELFSQHLHCILNIGFSKSNLNNKLYIVFIPLLKFFKDLYKLFL